MSRFIFVIALVFALSGCADLKQFTNSAESHPIVVDSQTFVQGVTDLDWPKVHGAALRLQDAYVVIAGSRTLRHEYGPICVNALEEHFKVSGLGSIRIVRDSELVTLIERWGTLSTVYAVTIGPRVVHVGKDQVLDVPHEVAHTIQWAEADDSFLIQYLPVVVLGGYEQSVFEIEAKAQATAFTDQYGVVCEHI